MRSTSPVIAFRTRRTSHSSRRSICSRRRRARISTGSRTSSSWRRTVSRRSSTANHLARELRARGSGSGADIVVLDKSSPGAGASGIACGVVRNNYFQPAMSELMQACVEVWESDPAAYHYNPVGYIALGASVQQDDLIATYERQEQIGYRSELIVGAADVDAHMKALFPDWRARGVTVCLHEHQGGFAFNMASVLGLAQKCESEGVTISSGVEVRDFEFASDDSGKTVVAEDGSIAASQRL